MKLLMLFLTSVLLGITLTIWCYEGGVHQAINVGLYLILTQASFFMCLEDYCR